VRTILAVALALAADPASAHCYSVWHYKTPQRCSVQVASRTPPQEDPRLDPPLPPEPPPVRLDFSKPTLQAPMQWIEDTERAFAIQKLREKMERK
jgi:hypothetical protein